MTILYCKLCGLLHNATPTNTDCPPPCVRNEGGQHDFAEIAAPNVPSAIAEASAPSEAASVVPASDGLISETTTVVGSESMKSEIASEQAKKERKPRKTKPVVTKVNEGLLYDNVKDAIVVSRGYPCSLVETQHSFIGVPFLLVVHSKISSAKALRRRNLM